MDTEDSDTLFKLLTKALDKKLLSSKAAVTYDNTNEKIMEIKGLVYHTDASNKTKFQILEKKTATTLKRRPSIASQTPGNQPPKDLVPTNSSELKNESRGSAAECSNAT